MQLKKVIHSSVNLMSLSNVESIIYIIIVSQSIIQWQSFGRGRSVMISQSVGRSVGQSVSWWIGRSVGQSVNKSANESVSHSASQSFIQSAKHRLPSQSIDRSISLSVASTSYLLSLRCFSTMTSRMIIMITRSTIQAKCTPVAEFEWNQKQKFGMRKTVVTWKTRENHPTK